jgi:hypothetical protein
MSLLPCWQVIGIDILSGCKGEQAGPDPDRAYKNRNRGARKIAMRVLVPALLLACFAHAEPTDTARVHVCMVTSPRETEYVQNTSLAMLKLVVPYPYRLTFTVITTGTESTPSFRQLQPRELADCNETGQDTAPLPSCKVQQQALDVAGALDMCHDSFPLADWILLMEDDFMPCEGALDNLLAVLRSLDPRQTKFARFTQGGGVVAFPRANVPLYTQSVRLHRQTQPCDRVLLLPWSDRPDFVHTTHLFQHIGLVSTIPDRNSPEYLAANSAIRDNACGAPITV